MDLKTKKKTIKVDGFREYRNGLKELEEKIWKMIEKEFKEDNLLSLKIALMGCVRRAEEKMRERKE